MLGDRVSRRYRTTRLVLPLALVCLMGGVAACGRPVPAVGQTHAVRIKNFVFEPVRLEVQPGDTIVWTNEDIVPHTATSKQSFDSKGIEPGKSWQFVARATGTFAYVCTFHPTMKGEVVVR